MTTALTGLVLIVDDTQTNLEVLSETLETAGLEVAIALSGEQALEQLQYSQPDLILLDVMMPGIDGFEVCQRLKQSPATQHIPVIFMTALADIVHRIQGLELGAVDYITKPFHEKEVLVRVATHLQLSQLTRHLEQQVSDRTQELQQAFTQLQASQVQLIQSEKMSALGNLVAGVAHEINNPVGCIVGNVGALEEGMNDLFDLLDLYQQELPQPSPNLAEKLELIDLNYLRADLPKLVKAMKDGGYRIKSISHSLRTFSRADSNQKQRFDSHEGIDSTLLILRHRLKANEKRPEIEVVTNYADIPTIQCFPGQLNQVFMNILANAIDALEEHSQGRSYSEIEATPNRITIQTKLEGNQIKIVIADNGSGIPNDLKDRIFDHLFTTKGVGKGTGLGLTISRRIIVENHGGSLDVQSDLGRGTEFCIRLPIVG
ncbi:MAG: response regulator [Synechococcales bacterium]|nr:response regulator [Synechococcales bacterium]